LTTAALPMYADAYISAPASGHSGGVAMGLEQASPTAPGAYPAAQDCRVRRPAATTTEEDSVSDRKAI